MERLVIDIVTAPLMKRLRRRAKRDRISVEEVAYKILAEALQTEREKKRSAIPLGTRIQNRFKKIGFRPGEEIKEFRGQPVRPATFDD